MIDQQAERIRHDHSRLRTAFLAVVGVLILAGTVYAAAPGAGGTSGTSDTARAASELPSLTELEARVERLDRGWSALSAYYESQVSPIEDVLRRYHDDEHLVSRVSAAVVREARAAGLPPRLLVGVLLVENPWLDPTARSFVGAVGLMQIMPVHQGGWSCGWDLEQIDTNVCLGARVFAHYLQRTGGDVEKALLRYNGCVTGSNTPNCHQYPSRVLARAGTGASSLLAWGGGQVVSAGSP